MPLQVIEIHFDTGTYDNIQRDVKVTISAQLGLIGGTMGLLTGFSILSAIEIIYFIGRIITSAEVFKTVRITEEEKCQKQLNKVEVLDTLNDFLMSSTIHGLKYISRAQVFCFLIRFKGEINLLYRSI